MEDLKQKIKRIRKEKRISQAELAESAGISRISYTYFENGTTDKLSLDAAIGIAKALDMSFNELFDIPDKTDTLQNRIKELEDELAVCHDRNSQLYADYKRKKELDKQGLQYRNLIMHTVELFEVLDFDFFEKHHPYLSNQLKRIETYSTDSVFRFLGEKEFDKLEQAEDYLLPFIDIEKYQKSNLLYLVLLAQKGSEKWTKESLLQRVIDAKKRLE